MENYFDEVMVDFNFNNSSMINPILGSHLRCDTSPNSPSNHFVHSKISDSENNSFCDDSKPVRSSSYDIDHAEINDNPNEFMYYSNVGYLNEIDQVKSVNYDPFNSLFSSDDYEQNKTTPPLTIDLALFCGDQESTFYYHHINKENNQNFDSFCLDQDSNNSYKDDEEEIDVVCIEDYTVNDSFNNRKQIPDIKKPMKIDCTINELKNRSKPSNKNYDNNNFSSDDLTKSNNNFSYKADDSASKKRAKLSVCSAVSNVRDDNSKHLNNHSLNNSHNNNSIVFGNETEMRRFNHNVLERKRRNDLRTSFNNLKLSLPDMKSSEKSSKVCILRKAADYINCLNRENALHNSQVLNIKNISNDLLNKIKTLIPTLSSCVTVDRYVNSVFSRSLL